jgi:cytochrome c553
MALALASARAEAAENQALGRYLAVECTGCHQLSGKSSSAIPSIVGWPEEQFAAALNAYGRKERGSQVMQAVAARLSGADIAALAAYFSTLPQKP